MSILVRAAFTAAFSVLVCAAPSGAQESDPTSSIMVNADIPLASATVTIPFRVSGWALNRTSAADSGIDAIQIWASAGGGAAPIFLGAASTQISRPDVAAALGAQYAA